MQAAVCNCKERNSKVGMMDSVQRKEINITMVYQWRCWPNTSCQCAEGRVCWTCLLLEAWKWLEDFTDNITVNGRWIEGGWSFYFIILFLLQEWLWCFYKVYTQIQSILTNNFSLFVKVASMNSLETELLIILEGLNNKK